MSNQNNSGAQEKLAAIISAAIVLTAVVYWIVQIKGAMDMLKLAYG
jgi:hypothetical protein